MKLSDAERNIEMLHIKFLPKGLINYKEVLMSFSSLQAIQYLDMLPHVI